MAHNGAADMSDPYYETPSFDLDQVQLQFAIANLKQLLVSNNVMYLVMDKSVYSINLNSPSNVKQFAIPSSEASIAECWLSPNGSHLVCQTSGEAYYYLHSSYDKFKILPKFKGLQVKLVCFPYTTEPSESTNDFLLVTADDAIYVAHIKSHDPVSQPNKKDDKYVKLLYKSPSVSIVNLTFSDNNLAFNLFTPTEHLQWDCFDFSYAELNKVLKATPNVAHKYSAESSQLLANDSSYAFVTLPSNSVFSNDQELELSQTKALDSSFKLSDKPHSAVLTKHHVIALSSSHRSLYIFNKLSKSSPIEFDLNPYVEAKEKVLGLIADPVESTFWVYTRDAIYELMVTNESISVWYNYFKMGKYDEALKGLESTNEQNWAKKDMVLIKQGYDYLQRGAFGIDYGEEEADLDLVALQIKGIRILGQSSEPFEKVSLMLLNLQHTDSSVSHSTTHLVSEQLLVEYLLAKFKLAKAEMNRIRMVVLSSWIIELMLRIRSGLEIELDLEKSHTVLNGVPNGKHLSENIKSKILTQLDEEFHSFLRVNCKLLDAPTVYQIISQLNFPDKLVYFAELNKDYEFILNHYIDHEEWAKATKILIQMYTEDFKKYEETIFKKSTVMLVNHTKETIEMWLKFDDLNYERLLPTILTYNKNNSKISIFDNHTLRFFQSVIYSKNVRSKVINNYYLSILITYPISKEAYEFENDPKLFISKQILKFLNFVKSDQSNSSNYYDPGFILRLCINYSHFQPAILILINDMKLFKQALKLSLDNDLVDLSIYILTKYDEYVYNEDMNLENKEEFDIINRSALDEDDNKNIGKNKLEEESFTEGKTLWLMFSSYLITNVCEGKTYSFLDEANYNDDDIEASGLKEQNGDGNSVNDVTNALVDSMGVDTSGPISRAKANKVLRFLLKASYSTKMKARLVGLKDLLPLFPETIMVNNFKEEIIKSLNQYNNRINQLSVEMKESLNISNKLKQQINESNEKIVQGKIYTIIEPGESCRLCNNLLINKNFISFPNCHHNFHKECLVKHYLMSKGDYRFKKVFQSFKKNNSIANKQELDDIMVSECVLCNESNIITIDDGLIDPTKDSALVSEWAL